MIPALNSEGLLPPGIHAATWQEARAAFAWNSHRASLMLGLSDALDALARAHCGAFWLDGSFVTDKEYPSDYDGCWDPTGVLPVLLDPVLIDYSPNGRAAIKSKYLGDILVAGIETGSGLAFVDFFQKTRDGKPKGIVLLNPQETR